MVSVTSEVSANTSFQNAAARSARPDSEPSAGNDSFAALVDSNTAASNNDNRTQDNAPAPRRSDDAQAASDNRSRDNAAASDKADKAARNDSNDRNAAANARSDKARDDDKSTPRQCRYQDRYRHQGRDDPPRQIEARRAEVRWREVRRDDAGIFRRRFPGNRSDRDGAGWNGRGDGRRHCRCHPGCRNASDDSFRDTSNRQGDRAACDRRGGDRSLRFARRRDGAGRSDATEAAATVTQPANAAQADGGAKTGAQGGVGQAVSAQATSADPSITTGIAQAASVVAATPAATKAAAQLKNPDLARKGATTAVEQAGTTDTAAPATPAADTIVPAVTPPTEAAGKPKSENGIADAVKADASGNSITPPAANAQAHAHLAAADIGQTPVNSSGNGLQAAGAIQTQQPAAAATTPAAAAQLTATAAASAPVPVSGLAMEIAASAKSGKTRFEIRLDPAELGRIDVRIDIDRHGQMTSHLTVERPETLSMLRQDANQLQRALDNAGLSTGNGGLQFSLRDQSSQGQNDGNQSNPNAHRLVVSEEDSVPAVVAGRNYGRMLGSSGGVDIRV